MKQGFMSKQKVVKPLRGTRFNRMSPTIPVNNMKEKHPVQIHEQTWVKQCSQTCSRLVYHGWCVLAI